MFHGSFWLGLGHGTDMTKIQGSHEIPKESITHLLCFLHVTCVFITEYCEQ